MFILLCLLLGAAMTFAVVREFSPQLKGWRLGIAYLWYTVMLNGVTLLVIRFGLHKTKYVQQIFGHPSMMKLINYVLFALGLMCVYLVIRYIGRKSKFGFVAEPRALSKKQISSYAVVSLFIAAGLFISVGAVWFLTTFGKITPEQLAFQLNSTTDGADTSVTDSLWNGPIVLLVIATMTGIRLLWGNWSLKAVKWHVSAKWVKGMILALLVSIVGAGLYYAAHELRVTSLYRSIWTSSEYVKDNYVDPDKTKLKFPEQKRNLVHIYLESYENSYLAKKDGGNMDTNLMPDLQKLSEEGVHFSDSTKFGGPEQTYGSSWSVAGMVNMSAGLPLKVSTQNAYGKEGSFLPGATNMGDILAAQGYNQTVMFGADADFGGLTTYYKTHGDHKIYDYSYARANGKIPTNYKEFWGFEDKKLYQYAQEELTELAAQPEPFSFVMENADTHFPNGYKEKGMAEPFDQQYANVIFHSQAEVTKFVRWIQSQPFYENTTIVLTGDHLSMDKKFFKDFDPSYHRTTFNLILNGTQEDTKMKTTNRQYASFDYFPTILSNMGVDIKGDRLRLGTDLSSKTPTLLERDGVDYFNREMERKSPFYETEFVSEEGHESHVMIPQVENFNNTYGHILPKKK
ncbi:LTA synthase family protein [Weissella ceti]|uniref:Glycerol phosphate lipoteichoic acid synthase 1 n=1 Tax=Weissella ceti TaxID=759620 RepID=A0A088GH45_9LACO|nr:LTA synthase family protein [Weissella ceti]AIM63281.1 Glycerol phosphate lipoteichoic acid synthase 1 [Weissella ceti]